MADLRMETVEIASLAFGGAGVGRLPSGKVVFVDGTVPGETVRVILGIERKSHAVASLEQVLVASPDRVEPPCPSALRCGACSWQHIAIEAQRAWKSRLLSAELDRAGLGTAALEHMLAGEPLGTRTRARMRLAGRSFGTTGRRSHSVVPLVACPVLEPQLWRFARAMARALGATRGGEAEVEMYADARGQRGMHVEPGPSGRGPVWREIAAQLDVHCMRTGTGPASSPSGEPSLLEESSAGVAVSFEPGVFVQTSRSMNEILVAHAMGMAGAGGTFAEVYAGAGNFTVHLARTFGRGSAAERDGTAARLLRRNVEAAAPGGDVRIVRERDSRSAVRLASEPAVDLLLADPPRSGMADLAPLFKGSPPRRVVMVSCHPMAAVRDIRMLVREAGYGLSRIVPVDMFPHTDHLEVIVLLERRGA